MDAGDMNKTEFPVLYKKSSQGKIETWEVYVAQKIDGRCHVNSTFGELGGKMQTTFDTITEGKNLGKKNETTVYEQACKEAEAKWEKKKKKGYVESLEAAQAGQVDELIEGGVEPMLAHVYEKHGTKIKFPCLAQPKLDGIRCIAIKKGPNVTLWSRTRKRITSCPHIEQSIAFYFAKFENLVLDGELYNHELKHDFEKIVSAVRKEGPSPESEKVQYHIYDVVDNTATNLTRVRWLTMHSSWHDSAPLKMVTTESIQTEEGIAPLFTSFRKQGYEGLMLRNTLGMYENGRSYDLQKVKEFEDAEFNIVRVKEGKGRLVGHAIFVCSMESGQEFEVKLAGDTTKLKEYFDNPESCIGKALTVQFQGYTGKNKVPRFPVGLRIREDGL